MTMCLYLRLSLLLAGYCFFLKTAYCEVESPIPNLESSLLASAARSSIIAVQCSSLSSNADDSVVLVSFSRRSEMSESLFDQSIMNQQEPAQLLNELTGLVIAATGLISDTNHLLQLSRHYISMMQHMHSFHSSDTHRFVKDAVARTLLKASETRALGVQALIVGNNPTPTGTPLLQLYTTDPSGNFKHFGSGATSIGWSAGVIRKKLEHILSRQEHPNLNNPHRHHWEQVLEIAIQAFLQALLLEDELTFECVNVKHDDDRSKGHFTCYQPGQWKSIYLDHGWMIHAMVILGDSQVKQHGYRWATVSPSLIQDCLERGSSRKAGK